MSFGLHGSRVRARNVQPVHHYIPCAEAVHGCGQLGGNPLAVHVDHQCSFFGVVQALAHTHAEEGGIPLHQDVCNLLLDGYRGTENRSRQGGDD